MPGVPGTLERSGAQRALVSSRLHFIVSFALFSALLAVIEPMALAHRDYVIGLALAVVAAVLGVAAWSRRWPAWVLAVFTGVDLVAVAFTNAAVNDVTGTGLAALLALLPSLWLAYWFGYPGAGLGAAGSFAVSMAPGWLHGEWPVDSVEWATLFAFPLGFALIGVATAFAVRRFHAINEMRVEAISDRSRIDSTFRTVVAEVGVWIIVFDLDGNVVRDNRVLTHIGDLSTPLPDVRGSLHVYALDRVTPIAPEAQAYPRVLNGEIVQNEIFWVGPRGKQRAVLVNGRPIEGEGGASIGSVIILQDITEMQMEVLEREESLASLSHELRSPLTSIVGYSDLMEEELEGTAHEATAAKIRRSAEHMLELTQSLLSAFRDGDKPHWETTNVLEIVERSVDMQRAAQHWERRALHLAIDRELSVEVDPRLLLQILNNLIGNAVKYSPADAQITVAAEGTDTGLVLTVHNTGRPIPSEQLERIFDRFYRAPGAETGGIRGLGIGLALSRRMAMAHGGSLTATSSVDGSSFQLQIPVP